jgi:hypothetical protein
MQPNETADFTFLRQGRRRTGDKCDFPGFGACVFLNAWLEAAPRRTAALENNGFTKND